MCRKERDTSRGSPRSFAAQRTLAQDDNQTAPLPPVLGSRRPVAESFWRGLECSRGIELVIVGCGSILRADALGLLEPPEAGSEGRVGMLTSVIRVDGLEDQL